MDEQPAWKDWVGAPVTVGTGLLAVATTAAWWIDLDVSALVLDPRAFGSQPWRLLTSSLLHVHLLHLGFNLYWLWVFGSVLERIWGGLRVLGFFLLVAATSAAAEYALFEGGVGLSGVGYGLFGLLWLLGRNDPRFRGVVTQRVVVLFVGWFFFCIAATVADVMPVANVAHGVGAATGMLVAQVASRRGRARRPWEGAIAALVLVSFLGATALRPRVNVSGGALGPAALGVEALERGDPEAAVAHFREATDAYDEDHRWVYNTGVALERLDRLDEAVERYERAHELAPEDPSYRRAVGHASAELGFRALGDGRHRAAMRHYARALTFVRDEPTYWNNYGVALNELGHRAEAEDAFARADALRAGDPSPQ